MGPKSAVTYRSVADQLLESLKNEDIAAAIGKAMSPFISLAVSETVKNTMQEITKSFKELALENRNLQQKVKSLEDDNTNIKKRLVSAEDRLEVIERESRRGNIIIRGLPESSYAERASAATSGDDTVTERRESVCKTVCDMLQTDMDIRISPDDILSVFRMKAGPRDKIRPVLVKFQSSHIRDKVMGAKKVLRLANKPIFLSDHLTRAAGELFFSARALVKQHKIHAAWTFNGQVFIRIANDNARPQLIRSSNDLPR